ncbi:Serine acetyltransferase (EC [Olavius algarvensis associated proteobacterium Delta 3]|nr:Serine acetyltransferase (EC [Olavius algarvensis associated proteobacterium Delta 3]CAB5154610.1 Serine acetyltransferase (EC [Olavius algarvensis associated proteobacterium Delta 3]
MSKLGRWLLHYLGNLLRWFKICYLRFLGIKIGKNCMISLRSKFDTRRGTIVVGNNCTITYGCIIVSHDASAMHIHPEDDGEGSVVIGNNVYIGVGSIILRNVTIGDNSVIGAGSVVLKDIPENVVAAGNPARTVKTIS